MITPKIKKLFQFIDYLHSNIDNFNQYESVINEIHILEKERIKLKPRNNFKDKLRIDEVKEYRNDKFSIIKENIISPIINKAIELDVYDFEKNSWCGIETEIHKLKDNFSKDDLTEIFSHKNKYLEYRTETKSEDFFSLVFFFQNLDELSKELFDFFKIGDQNEFEAIQGFKKGQTKFTLSNNFLLNTSTIQQQPKTDYWEDDAEEITLIAEYQKAVNKLVEGGDTGCFPMRFRVLPRVVLNENKYSLQRKKYLLKQMRLVLDEVKNTEIGRELFTDLYERIEPYADIFRFVFSETPLPQPIKYGANEYALTYIFDLYAIGQQVPINRIEGSFDAKKIKQDASKFPMYDKAPDTFYRAVKSVLEYDLNKPTDLQNISKDWLNAVRNLSTNWVITEQYLKDKNLIGE